MVEMDLVGGKIRSDLTVSVIVGDRKPRSRTYQTANLVAEGLVDRSPDLVVDLADVASALVDCSSAEVAALKSRPVQS